MLAVQPPAGVPVLGGSEDQDLWEYLSSRPTIPISVGTTAVSKQIWPGACILDGWQLRETTGLAGALVEFLDGPDANGTVIGELVIPAPSSTAAGNSDTDVDNSATGAAAAIVATLPGVAGQTTFITGFEVTGGGATGASVVVVTVTGILGGTKSYVVAVPAGATLGITPLVVQFPRPIPASGLNTAIAVNVPNLGAGNTNAAVTAHGFQRLAAAGAASQGQTASGPGGLNLLLVKSGLFMRVIAGSVTGAVWLKV